MNRRESSAGARFCHLEANREQDAGLKSFHQLQRMVLDINLKGHNPGQPSAGHFHWNTFLITARQPPLGFTLL
jgi:hypothetical protein